MLFGKCKRKLKMILWKSFICPTGKHQDINVDGTTGNFCEACGMQTNPDAFKDYSVRLNDGTEIMVSGVNEHHAKSLVVYGDNLKFDGRSGMPIGDIHVHPDNIRHVQVVTDCN